MTVLSALTNMPIAASSSSGSWLITPDVGLMIWTLVVFGVSLYILNKAVFPRLRDILDKRQHSVEETMDAADRTRGEADKLLDEYRERLREARQQAEEILQRARHTAEGHQSHAIEEAQAKREEMMEQARREIQAETRRALEQIRGEVADLTVMATERVTRKVLTEEDQRRLVSDALQELDFSALSAGSSAN